ncbi:MAG: hypothetical protein AAF573_15805 [Bacteroidota bacterium]
MKFKIRFFFLITIASYLIIGFTACNNDDDDSSSNPSSTGDLFLNFKLDGTEKSYSSTFGFWGGNSGTDVSIWASLDGFIGSDITLNFKNKDIVTFDDLIDLEGQTLAFDNSGEVYADFIIDQDDIDANTYNADNPPASYFMEITDTREETGILGNPFGKLVRVTGTFQCRLDEVSGSGVFEVTEGSFSLVFQEFL